MDIGDIIKTQTWDELLVVLENRLYGIIEHNLRIIEGINEEAKTIKPGSSFDVQIKEHEQMNMALARILESKKK